MSNEIPTISTEAELLALLRANPATRGVSYYRDEDLCVAELTEDAGRIVRVLAWIDSDGSADAVLQQAHEADCEGDVATWKRLPLRYGPYCSTWVLPEHPKAPAKAGGDE